MTFGEALFVGEFVGFFPTHTQEVRITSSSKVI